MKHRHAVDRAKPLRSALRVSVVFTLLGLPAIASDRPDAIRLPDTGRFPENVTSASNGRFAGPTGVTVAGDRIWVAEGQLGLLSKAAKDGGEAPSFHLRSVDVD